MVYMHNIWYGNSRHLNHILWNRQISQQPLCFCLSKYVRVTGQECAKLRILRENMQLKKQKNICEANFAWIFACYWDGVNSNNGYMRDIV